LKKRVLPTPGAEGKEKILTDPGKRGSPAVETRGRTVFRLIFNALHDNFLKKKLRRSALPDLGFASSIFRTGVSSPARFSEQAFRPSRIFHIMDPVIDSLPLEIIRRKNFLYIDKTVRIKKLLKRRERLFFLQRPRRFGKSLLVTTMLNIFKGNSGLFVGLALNGSN
jgi:hypothetical protein